MRKEELKGVIKGGKGQPSYLILFLWNYYSQAL